MTVDLSAFHFPGKDPVRPDEVRYRIRIDPHTKSRVRHAFSLSTALIKQIGWKTGETKVLVGFGDPGGKDAGRAVLVPHKDGHLFRSTSKQASTGHIEFTLVSPWISSVPHESEACPSWRIEGGALIVELPKWATISEIPSEERKADRPPAAEARSATTANHERAQAGGSDSAGDSATPPAAIQGPPELTAAQRAIYDHLVALADAGATMPTLSALAAIAGKSYGADASNALAALERRGLIRREGVPGNRSVVIVASGKMVKAWNLGPSQAEAAPSAPPAAKPSPREAEAQQIADAVAAGKVTRMPSGAELAAITKQIPPIETAEAAIKYLRANGFAVKRGPGLTWGCEGTSYMPAVKLCEYARLKARDLAVERWRRGEIVVPPATQGPIPVRPNGRAM